MTQRSNSPLFGNLDSTPRPYQVSNDWVFNICEALSHIDKNVKIRKFFASPEKLVKCSYNSFALTPRHVRSSYVVSKGKKSKFHSDKICGLSIIQLKSNMLNFLPAKFIIIFRV